ncbi:unnamed protein product [Caretta caretta]
MSLCFDPFLSETLDWTSQQFDLSYGDWNCGFESASVPKMTFPSLGLSSLLNNMKYCIIVPVNLIHASKQNSIMSPKNPEQKIIKRVIALEGDIVKTIGYKNKYVKIPHGHIWVEGDHHGHSFDSNAFGPVSLGLLHARATHILWPPRRWQKLQPMLPPERIPLRSDQE